MKNKMKKFFNKVKSYFSQPSNVILVIFLLILAAGTLTPLISMLVETFITHSSEVRSIGGKVGDVTINSWKQILTSTDYNYSKNYFYTPLFNSIKIALLAAVIAIVIGGVFAWFITRTNIKFKKFFSTVFIFPYIMPSWTLALFWTNMFSNINVTGCSANGILASVFGIYAPSWLVFGAVPISIVLGLHYAPFAYILIGGILKNMDANLEEAATILKTPRRRILTKITLPIVRPAIMSTFLLVFASSISAYAVPVFLGSPANYLTLTTTMKFLNSRAPAQGYIIAITLIVMGLLILGINQYFTGRRKSYTTVTGKSSQVSYINLKKANYPLAILGCLFVFSMSILPLITFVLESLIIEPGNYSFSNMTLDFWIGGNTPGMIEKYGYGWTGGILRNSEVWRTLGNSILLSVTCALVAGTCGLLIGYAVVKKRNSKLAGIVSTLAFIPYLIPAMAFGAAYLAFSTKITFLYGTFLLLAIVGSIKYMPFATRASTGAMMQLSGEIEEAAVLTGTPWWKRMTKIIFPIQKSSFLSGYLLPFISCMRELSLFVLIVASRNSVITTLLMYYDEKGYDQYGNALNLLIVLFVLLVNWLVNKITGASIDKGVGGN